MHTTNWDALILLQSENAEKYKHSNFAIIT